VVAVAVGLGSLLAGPSQPVTQATLAACVVSPIVVPGAIVTRMPIHTFRPMVTARALSSTPYGRTLLSWSWFVVYRIRSRLMNALSPIVSPPPA
jgi:hypothetical protein